MHVMMLAQQVLRFLEPADQSRASPISPSQRLEQVAEPLDVDPGSMDLFYISGTGNSGEIDLEPGDMLPPQLPWPLSGRLQPLTSPSVELDPKNPERAAQSDCGLPI